MAPDCAGSRRIVPDRAGSRRISSRAAGGIKDTHDTIYKKKFVPKKAATKQVGAVAEGCDDGGLVAGVEKTVNAIADVTYSIDAQSKSIKRTLQGVEKSIELRARQDPERCSSHGHAQKRLLRASVRCCQACAPAVLPYSTTTNLPSEDAFCLRLQCCAATPFSSRVSIGPHIKGVGPALDRREASNCITLHGVGIE